MSFYLIHYRTSAVMDILQHYCDNSQWYCRKSLQHSTETCSVVVVIVAQTNICLILCLKKTNKNLLILTLNRCSCVGRIIPGSPRQDFKKHNHNKLLHAKNTTVVRNETVSAIQNSQVTQNHTFVAMYTLSGNSDIKCSSNIVLPIVWATM